MSNIRPLYEATVLLSGSRDNSVWVPSVTAAELYVLKAIHGNNERGTDPILNVKKTGKGVDRSDDKERARIGTRYNAAGASGGIAILNALYGVGNKLPLEYEEPASTEHSDAPLRGEAETLIDLAPEGPITSKPETKKTVKSSVLDDVH